MTGSDLHPIIVSASAGRLPAWARVNESRVPHLERVAGLMEMWAGRLGLKRDDGRRWAAVGWLHDSLRDADPDSLFDETGEFPKKVRHGPAAAARLRQQGIDDEELLEAIAYHTLGRPQLGRLGRFLFMADYLEPGREFESNEREALRSRLPAHEREVLREVCARRIAWRLREGKPVRRETVEFWNELVDER